ncbi:MAG: CapA family protein [Candidatus Krumholzibacteriota bacterium]|nr:CapA family protein [Candidatus Krumholzibacteriota bacterium]
MSGRAPRWFRDADRSPRFRLDRATGRIAPPDRDPASGEVAAPGVQSASGDGLLLYVSGDVIWERDLMAYLLERPADHALGRVREIWADGDIVFAQQETCYGESRDDELPGKRISYLTDPRLLPHLAAGGFNLACLASNHTMDYGIVPVEYTRRALAELGIACSGCGRDLAAAREPALVEARGRTVALLAYATDDEETNAGPARPGNAPLQRELVVEDVRAARERADFVLVSVHKGREFVYFPSPDHQADCRAIVDAGADVILGHHPHFIQGLEWRRRPDGRQALIAYSLGSLLIDYEPALTRYEQELFWRSQRNNFVAALRLDAGGVADLRLTPVRQTADWSVRRETPDETVHTWDLVEWTSHPLNHPEPCRKFWVTGWAYLAMQYPALILQLRRRPASIRNALGWMAREETVRLHWGALFARDMPAWLLALRRRVLDLTRRAWRGLRGQRAN